MATTRRRKNLNIIEKLKLEPHSFNFFQAVRILEREVLEQSKTSHLHLAGGVDLLRAKDTFIRFSTSNSLAFNGSDITDISQVKVSSTAETEASSQQWQVEVALMGLIGSQGVLPYHFSEMVTAEQRIKNLALKDFFDLFNHRAVSLYYSAWQKYQMPVVYENQKTQNKHDLFTEAFLSLAGLGNNESWCNSALHDEGIARFAGHLGRNVCSAEFLRSCISEMFELEVEIEQFKGIWYELDEDARCQLPSERFAEGVNNCLGLTTILGKRCFQVQNKFTLVIIPHSEEEFNRCSPGSSFLEKLKSFIRLSVGQDQDFDIEVRVSDQYISLSNISNPTTTPLLLGWNVLINPTSISRKSLNIRLSQDVRPTEKPYH